MRESDGDGQSYLGQRGGAKNAKLLAPAAIAYADAQQAFDDVGNWQPDRDRTRLKKVKIQLLLGRPVSPVDQALANIPPPASIDFSTAQLDIAPNGRGPLFDGFAVSIYQAKLNGKVLLPQFHVLTDYASTSRAPNTINLLRIVIRTSSLDDPASKSADYSKCGELAYQPDEVRLHYGNQATLNACILSKMAPADAAVWERIYSDLPTLFHEAAAKGETIAAHFDPLFALMPAH